MVALSTARCKKDTTAPNHIFWQASICTSCPNTNRLLDLLICAFSASNNLDLYNSIFLSFTLLSFSLIQLFIFSLYNFTVLLWARGEIISSLVKYFNNVLYEILYFPKITSS